MVAFKEGVSYSITKKVDKWMVRSFRDGKKSCGMMEDLIADVFDDFVVTSYDGKDSPDIIYDSIHRVEVKSSSETTARTNLLTSLEARGANGKGGTQKSQALWDATFLLLVCRFWADDDGTVTARVVSINTAKTAMKNGISRKEFDKMYYVNPVERL